MLGKQTANIVFDGYDHMDALYAIEDYGMGPQTEGGAHYLYKGAPSYASQIAVCEDEERKPQYSEEPNKYINAWRKIYDESWMEDSHYFMGAMWERPDIGQYWWTQFICFPYYKNYFGAGLPFNYYVNYCHVRYESKIIVSKRESWSYGTSMGFDTDYYDYVDGKHYHFPDDNKVRICYITQNAMDWYPVFIQQKFYNGTITHDSDDVKPVEHGFYIGVSPGGLVFVPCYPSDEDSSITVGEPRYLPQLKDVDRHGILFIFGDNLYYVMQINKDSSNCWRVTKITSHGDVSYTYGNYNNQMLSSPGQPLGIIGNKAYFYTYKGIGTYWGAYHYWAPSYENIKYSIVSIDSNGNFETVYSENGTVIQDPNNGRLEVRQSKLGSIFNNSHNILYDEKTKYYYIYSMVPYSDYNFPKQQESGENFTRLIITRTKNFRSWEHFEGPPYRIVQGRLKKNSAAICFDDKYLEQLRRSYWMFETGITYMKSYYGGTYGGHEFFAYFHNEKLSHPSGIILMGGQHCLKDYNNNRDLSSFMMYFSDYLLRETSGDFILTNKEYKSDLSVAWSDDSQTILNQLNGLDYPGKDA